MTVLSDESEDTHLTPDEVTELTDEATSIMPAPMQLVEELPVPASLNGGDHVVCSGQFYNFREKSALYLCLLSAQCCLCSKMKVQIALSFLDAPANFFSQTTRSKSTVIRAHHVLA